VFGPQRSFLWSVLLPFTLNVLNLGVDDFFFFKNFLLKRRDLLLHDLGALAQHLRERGPLSFDLIDPEPVLRPLVSLLVK